jgi:Panthothenate kinase
MQLVTTPRVALQRALRAEIVHNYPGGRVMIAVDGATGSGTGQFADGLAAVFQEAGTATARASIEDFHRPRAERHEGVIDSAREYYERSFDYRTLRRVLIDPFRMAGSTGFQTDAFDVRRDAPTLSSWLTGPADLVLVVDGVFLNRPELSGSWNYSVYLDVPLVDAYARLAEASGRDPDPEAPSNARYVGGLARYDAEVSPSLKASAVIDNRDPEHPRRVFPDVGCACG